MEKARRHIDISQEKREYMIFVGNFINFMAE